jgi:hypothetical protein
MHIVIPMYMGNVEQFWLQILHYYHNDSGTIEQNCWKKKNNYKENGKLVVCSNLCFKFSMFILYDVDWKWCFKLIFIIIVLSKL